MSSIEEEIAGIGGNHRITAINAPDLQTKKFAPISYVLPGYIPEGATILAGKPKVGKSWLLLDMCIACAAGRFVLGTIKPAQGSVLYLALEDNQRRLKWRMNKILPSGQWPAGLQLVTDCPRVNEGGLEYLRNWIKGATNPVAICIDTLEKFRPVPKGGTQTYSTDYDAITGLQRLAAEHGVAIVINHHVRKMDADDPFDTVSGTLGLTGAADTILILKKSGGNVTLYSQGRDIESRETAVQFDKASCRWTILGEASDIHRSSERAMILDALQKAGGELALSEIMSAVGRTDRNAVDQLLWKMKEAGEIIRVKRGVYAVAPAGANLTETPDDDPGKIGKKERNDIQDTEISQENGNLTNLTDLTGCSQNKIPDGYPDIPTALAKFNGAKLGPIESVPLGPPGDDMADFK